MKKALFVGSLALALLWTTVPTQATTITLQFNTLPSAQGWTYFQGGSVPEASVFSVNGTTLIQNTIGIGNGNPNYAMFGVVNGAQPFVLDIRARVLSSEGADAGGFFFDVRTAVPNQEYAMEFTTSLITDPLHNSVPLDTTTFHDYVLAATPGGPYSLFVDGQLKLTGPPSSTGGPLNAIQFGDGVGLGANNAHAEITELVFSQPATAPEPGTLGLLLSGLAIVGGFARRRLIALKMKIGEHPR
jgi:hypothetical protein